MATPFPFTAGQVLTAAELNGIGETWTSYTPTVTSSGGTITTVGAVSAAYTQVNKIVFVYVSIVITTVGTASGQLRFTLPITAATNMQNDTVMGTGRDSGVSAVQLQILKASNTLGGVLQYSGAGVFGLGNGVTCKGVFTYEAA
jgi:pectate lyase